MVEWSVARWFANLWAPNDLAVSPYQRGIGIGGCVLAVEYLKPIGKKSGTEEGGSLRRYRNCREPGLHCADEHHDRYSFP